MGILRPYSFLSKVFIERQANHLLHQMEATPFAPSWPFETALVADFLDLGVVWDRIPPDEIGEVAARILPTQRMIEINETLLDISQGYIESTTAHEIGHWMLHINQDALDSDIEVDDEPFVCRSTSNDVKVVESVEWQAQQFASCLLMPRWILDQKFNHRSFTNWSHLYEVKDELGVTISYLLHRLKDLNWITVDQKTRKIYRGNLRAHHSG
ncbi:MAG: ImmA/IrrE family metallo-endopeptidase [Oscillatoriales cyanobacterium RM2_1_1]|nr:ImmA/IrrE family metallo-endopeptidase [Oscillatoriales cyanobacterium SM2_3_0]NJO45496.1 ImmA/IrrE family metallo-endopeptidase [Oscillatoriales cyanobacterium RM2_1_1]